MGDALGNVRFVLVEPRTAGNVGATARALKNLGFKHLTLVRPGCDPSDDDARRMAVDARDLLEGSARSDDLDAALDGATMVVGATARTGKQRQPHWRLDRLAGEMAGVASNGRLACLFGPEDRGLTDGELDRCTHLIYLPSAEAYSSFNLSQAVLLVAYGVRMALLEREEGSGAEPRAAGHADREAMYQHLEEALSAIGFLKPDPAESVMRQLRRLLGRARMTEREVKLLRGAARQILWAARER